MFKKIKHQFKYGQHTLTIETGIIGRNATSSVVIDMDGTSVLITIVTKKISKCDHEFFPLTVNYQERTYAVGRIPGGFFRREGRPNENETLTSRLIDRSIRPLFPKNLLHEVQIIATVISANTYISPDIVAIIGTSAALMISGIPCDGPIGAARVGYVENKYVLNPTVKDLKNSMMDLVIAGTKHAVLMVESETKILNEEKILEAIFYGHKQQKKVISEIEKFVNKTTKSDTVYTLNDTNLKIDTSIIKNAIYDIKHICSIHDRRKRTSKIEIVKQNIINKIKNINIEESVEVDKVIYEIEKRIMRRRIIKGKPRIDGRSENTIRNLDVKVGILKHTHGSALFTRGETQALVITTLGTFKDAQRLDGLTNDKTDNFLLHYNFPPYAVGEIGIISSPKRREIGHGRLVKRAIKAVMPSYESFPYTIRVVSEITESNGSSSMASVCGASLSLMDAGVPIKQAVAGVAMGLIKEKEKYIILSDILGDEDHLGDMDFKIAGSRNGITALQMDIKTNGITKHIIKETLAKAKVARLKILDSMDEIITKPRGHVSEFAPKIYIIKINKSKIKNIIGKNGTTIKSLTDETNTEIEVDSDGTIKISASKTSQAKLAISRIRELTFDIEIGQMYQATVTRVTDFGIFLSIGNKEGLAHISKIHDRNVRQNMRSVRPNDVLAVKVLNIDKYGRINLSIKDKQNIKDK